MNHCFFDDGRCPNPPAYLVQINNYFYIGPDDDPDPWIVTVCAECYVPEDMRIVETIQ